MTKGDERKQARKTALVVASVLGALAAWNVHRGRPLVAETLGGISAVLLILGLLLPAVAVYFHRGWMAIAGVLGYINSRILLSLIYFLVITPFGQIRGWMGKDPLSRRGARRGGYWIPREIQSQSKEQFERTF